MKCTKCKSESGKSKWCSACKKEWCAANRDKERAAKSRYARKFKIFRDSLKLGVFCKDCGVIYHPKLMDFDHISQKSHTIGHMNGGIETLKAEVENCEIVCILCHRTRTHVRRGPDKRTNFNKRAFKKRDFIRSAKNDKCIICLIQRPFWQMDFDHLSDKKCDLSKASKTLTEEEIVTEIRKCRLLCALCHRAETFGISAKPLI